MPAVFSIGAADDIYRALDPSTIFHIGFPRYNLGDREMDVTEIS
jgi:hypothetical protein